MLNNFKTLSSDDQVIKIKEVCDKSKNIIVTLEWNKAIFIVTPLFDIRHFKYAHKRLLF